MLTHIYRTLVPPPQQVQQQHQQQQQEQPPPQLDCPLCRITGTLTLSILSLTAFKEAWSLHRPTTPSVSPPRGKVVFLTTAGVAFFAGAIYRWSIYQVSDPQPLPSAVSHAEGE